MRQLIQNLLTKSSTNRTSPSDSRQRSRATRAVWRLLTPAALILLVVGGFSVVPSNSFVGRADAAPSGVSLAGVHWYSGDLGMLDTSVPLGQRGWNVEVIFDVGWCDGDPNTDPGGVRSVAQTAKEHGLVNIIRVDYRAMVAVPTNSADYPAWASNFIRCTSELRDLASLYIVGNEPNIEGDITAPQYAAAFNYLYSRRGEMPSGTQLLTTFNSPFTSPVWMNQMASRLDGVDGFTLHTGGIRSHCQDPRQPCEYGNWPFDGAFRYYRDVIDNIPSRWWDRPVYITELNTYTGSPGSEPQNNYLGDWINKAFEDVRNYNATRGSKPPVWAMAWFVDRPQSWPQWSLRNIPAARTDMSQEFKNPANRSGAPAPSPTPPPATPTPAPEQNVALGKSWRASSVYGADWGGDNAVDGVVSVASKWTSNGTTAESWLAIDLGQAYEVTRFVVRHAGAAGEADYFNTQSFRVEIGPSFSGPWTVLATVNNAGQTDDVSEVVLNAPATTRFLRLYITDAGIDNYARIPELEVYARGVVTPPPGAGLVNGGFEGGVQANGVGEGWSPFSSAGYGAGFAVVTDGVHSGFRSQRVSGQPTANDQFAGILQTVSTEPGSTYTIRAWNRVSLPVGSGWPIVGRLGIDLSGGRNYAAPSVTWIEFEAPEDGVGGWVVRERTVTASGTSMTIFLQSWHKWATGVGSEAWFDDVQVIQEP